MYYHIQGELSYKDANLAVVDCGGVGYKLNITYTTYSRLPEIGKQVKLFTHLVVKDDALDLLGFGDLAEKNAFLMLLSISGIGVKSALAVLSVLSPERFAYAVVSGDYKEIATAQGVSAKTAQKIILELKDKIDKENTVQKKSGKSDAQFTPGGFDSTPAAGNIRGDAINALIALGYSRNEAGDALKDADFTKPLEDIIKTGLKNSAKF
ncbi:MAG: Holliday junction branch migration protein RuvA [Oscillospiraceae bacterium]|nr:Holliday junction branch migration protein RuvA [Oscillospiraceae bacterium]